MSVAGLSNENRNRMQQNYRVVALQLMTKEIFYRHSVLPKPKLNSLIQEKERSIFTNNKFNLDAYRMKICEYIYNQNLAALNSNLTYQKLGVNISHYIQHKKAQTDNIKKKFNKFLNDHKNKNSKKNTN